MPEAAAVATAAEAPVAPAIAPAIGPANTAAIAIPRADSRNELPPTSR